MKHRPSSGLKYFITMVLVALVIIAGWQRNQKPVVRSSHEPHNTTAGTPNARRRIAELSDARVVITFIKKYKRLPDYYITKAAARRLGWRPELGNFCEVLEGRVIGGDYFSNREGLLPKSHGRTYFEADVDYHCGKRNGSRVIYSNDGLVFLTRNHYQTFQQQ